MVDARQNDAHWIIVMDTSASSSTINETVYQTETTKTNRTLADKSVPAAVNSHIKPKLEKSARVKYVEICSERTNEKVYVLFVIFAWPPYHPDAVWVNAYTRIGCVYCKHIPVPSQFSIHTEFIEQFLNRCEHHWSLASSCIARRYRPDTEHQPYSVPTMERMRLCYDGLRV